MQRSDGTPSVIHSHDFASHLSHGNGSTSGAPSPAAPFLRQVDGAGLASTSGTTSTTGSTSTTPSSSSNPLIPSSLGTLPHGAILQDDPIYSIPTGATTVSSSSHSSPHLSAPPAPTAGAAAAAAASTTNPLTHPLYTSLFPPADLPIANISRIMKRSLPENAKIAKDAKECVQDCVSELISFVTSEASDKCAAEKRKTINGDDILYALRVLGFDNYEEVLKVYLSRYRMAQETNPRSRKRSHKAATATSGGDIDDHDHDHDDAQGAGEAYGPAAGHRAQPGVPAPSHPAGAQPPSLETPSHPLSFSHLQQHQHQQHQDAVP